MASVGDGGETSMLSASVFLGECILFLLDIIELVGIAGTGRQSRGIQAHAPRNTSLLRQSSLGIDDGMAALGGLDQLRVLLLEERKVPFRFPVPDAVGSEEEVHFFERALVRFGVEGPDHGEGDQIGCGEDVVGVLVQGLEHDRAEECEPAVTDRPADDAPSITFGTDFQWEDLGGIQPRDGEPGRAECGCEEEDHGDGTGAVAFGHRRTQRVLLTEGCEPTGHGHGKHLND